MEGYKCAKCGRVYSIKKAVCPECTSREFITVDMGEECILLTYTELWVTPTGVSEKPLRLGIVEFPNRGRAFGQIITESPAIGIKLKPIWKQLKEEEGKALWGFAFQDERKEPK
ncbi:MAG: hypothetical protein M1388_03390 [Thaumarchaeota archaeon]|nr:hypothetical protein [Nitrososphaerota archaeon]